MAAFPSLSSAPAANPFHEEMEFKTLISQFDDLGEEKRKKKWLYPKRNITFQYNYITKAQGKTLWQFYLARGGSYEAFNVFYEFSDSYVDEYVGTGDGATTVFNLPAKTSSSYTLKVDGVDKEAGGVDYTFGSAGGTDGADKVTFESAPASGTRITWSFTGYLKVRARFTEDKYTWETFYDRLVVAGLPLKGLLNE